MTATAFPEPSEAAVAVAEAITGHTSAQSVPDHQYVVDALRPLGWELVTMTDYHRAYWPHRVLLSNTQTGTMALITSNFTHLLMYHQHRPDSRKLFSTSEQITVGTPEEIAAAVLAGFEANMWTSDSALSLLHHLESETARGFELLLALQGNPLMDPHNPTS